MTTFLRSVGTLTVLAAAAMLLPGCSGTQVAAKARTSVQSQATQSIVYRDIAVESGITYRWKIDGPRPLNILQTIGNGCAFIDFNNDGNLDILLIGPRLALYQGDGHGHFTDVTAATGLAELNGHFLGCATGDYDNDGWVDIYISAYRGGVLLHNEGAPKSSSSSSSSSSSVVSIARRFTDVTKASGIKPQPFGSSCAFGDIDNDGKLDLYVCNYVVFGPDTEPQLCEYSGHKSSCGPRFYQPEKGVLFHNDGNGRFSQLAAGDVSGKALGVAFADFNGSGRQHIAIANDEMAGDLLLNGGRGFKNIGASSGTAYDQSGNVHGGMGVDWGDYDNDGRLDLAVATFQHEAKAIYHNDGGSSFSEQSNALGVGEKTVANVAFGIKWLDADNDGWLDLVMANGHVQDNIHDIDRTAVYRQPSQLFRSVNGASFESIDLPDLRRPIVGRGLAIGDYDNDGRMDILIVDSEGAPLLLHNESPRTGSWITCRLVGKKSNRQGIGAIVTAEAGGRKIVRHCATDGSFYSASEPRVHIGLGNATSATIGVRWPSGATTIKHNVEVNRQVVINE